MIKEIDRDNKEIRVHFMHPHGPSRSFFGQQESTVVGFQCEMFFAKLKPC